MILHKVRLLSTWLNVVLPSACNEVMRRAALPLFLLALLGRCSPALAQETHPYASGAIEMATWGVHSWVGGSPSLTFINSSDDGPIFGMVGEAGVFFGRNVAVGAEIDVPLGRAEVNNTHGYFNPYRRISQYQEWRVFGVFHGYVPAGGRVRAGLLAGGGIVFPSTVDQKSTCNFDDNIACAPFAPDQEMTHSLFGATIGGEVAIQATGHLSVVPQFRVVWVARGDASSLTVAAEQPLASLGIDRVSYHAGIGLRVTF